MRKSVLSIGLALALLAGGSVSAKQGDIESLTVAAGEDNGSALDLLWSGMEVQVESFWSELRPEIESQRAHYFAPTGSPDSDWADAGVDMAALLARAPGGAAGNVLYSDDPDGPVLHVLDAAALKHFSDYSGLPEKVVRRVRELIPKESMSPDRIVGMDQIISEAVSMKFLPAPLSAQQVKDLVQIPN